MFLIKCAPKGRTVALHLYAPQRDERLHRIGDGNIKSKMSYHYDRTETVGGMSRKKQEENPTNRKQKLQVGVIYRVCACNLSRTLATRILIANLLYWILINQAPSVSLLCWAVLLGFGAILST